MADETDVPEQESGPDRTPPPSGLPPYPGTAGAAPNPEPSNPEAASGTPWTAPPVSPQQAPPPSTSFPQPGAAAEQPPHQQPPSQQPPYQQQAPYQQQPPYQPPPGYPQSGYGPPGYGPPTYPPGYGVAGYQQGPLGPGGQPFASFWARVGAWIIDFVIVGAITAALDRIFNAGHVAWVSIHYTQTTNGVSVEKVSHFSALSPIVSFLIAILYGAILIGSARGQTIGMMAISARAVDADSGQNIGFGRALGRALFEYLLFIVLVIPWVIDMLFPAWDAKRQTLHDKVTRTVVVKTPPR